MHRVLIVDDEELLRQGLLHLFDWEDQGFTVAGQAANGAEALAAVELELPDIVLTDVKMPVMDGIALIEALRSRFPRIRVIVLSSYNDFDYVRQTLVSGAVDYILKPRLNREELLAALRRAAETAGVPSRVDGNVSFYSFCSRPPGPEHVFRPVFDRMDPAMVRNLAERMRNEDIAPYVGECVKAAVKEGGLPTADAFRGALAGAYRSTFCHAAWLDADTTELRERMDRGAVEITACRDYQGCLNVFARLVEESGRWLEDTMRIRLGVALSQVWRYMWQNYERDLNLTDVADHFYINKSYLCQLFSKRCGTSFGSLLGNIRIAKARELLEDPRRSVVEVAAAAGYTSPGYFAKQFRRITGCTPSLYAAQRS